MKLRAVAVAVAVVLLAACNDDGRELRDAPPPAAAPTETPIFTDSESSVVTFGLRSPALDDGGTLDARFTCDGAGDFVPLTVVGADPKMVEFSVVVVDETTDHVHWVIAGIPPTVTTISPEAGLPDAAVTGTSTGGVTGWEPPCPPPGDEPHRYKFSLYAYAEPVGMQPGLPAMDARAVLPQSAVGFAELTAFYGRTE